jgi:DNA-binding IclR family transcriptional regulator
MSTVAQDKVAELQDALKEACQLAVRQANEIRTLRRALHDATIRAMERDVEDDE